MMPNIKKALSDYGGVVLFSVLLLLLWEGSVRSGMVPAFILPAPSGVVAAVWEYRSTLFLIHLPVTLWEVVLGLLLSVTGGVLLAAGMFYSRALEKIVYPLVVVSQTIPIIAISPIFILWFGYTVWSKVAVTVLIAFFPIVVNTYDGLKQGDLEYGELLRAMGASFWHVLLKVQIPMALPAFFSGLKMALVFCVIGATIGEWLGASEGLGYFTRRMSGSLRADAVFAAVLILSLLGIILFMIAALLERSCTRWKIENRK